MDSTSPDTTNKEDIGYPTRLMQFLKIGVDVDCKFLVGPDANTAEIITGHRSVFAVESSVFQSMFFGDFKEQNQLEIPIPEDNPKDFINLRFMLYSTDRSLELKSLSLCFDDVVNLYRLCDKYLITSLTKIIASYIKAQLSDLNDSDLLRLLSFADEYQIFSLVQKTWNELHKKGYPSVSGVTILNHLQFMEYIRNSKRMQGVDMVLLVLIEHYLQHHKLIPQNFFETRIQEKDEITHEILKSLLLCLDVETIDSTPARANYIRALPPPLNLPFRVISKGQFVKYMRENL